ncbi:hypothetical protein AVEN_55762-1 [Araneus ventricosus]|uniref:Uncharacterized protein n=1 Tax=Araneus ventricosus TaxID=182803 RepID=A0A4Y2EY31_ARAVE|nr:hypothetical protein AVEN_55762-1 [Araneus ventricosus]
MWCAFQEHSCQTRNYFFTALIIVSDVMTEHEQQKCFEKASFSPDSSAKASHSPLVHFGIFGTREGKAYRQGLKLMNCGANGLEAMEFQRTQNPKLKSADSNLGPRCGGSGKTKDLASRLEMKLETPRMGEEKFGWEEFCDFEPCLKTNFGASVNVLPNFSTKMSGIQTSCWNQWLSLSCECPYEKAGFSSNRLAKVAPDF